MPDNNTFLTNKKDKTIVLETTSTNIDVLSKVIKRIGIYEVHIKDSILYALDNSTKKFFTIFRIDCKDLIGEGVNLSFHIEKSKRKMLGKIKGNDKSVFYEIGQDFYLFINGGYTCSIPKIEPRNLKELIPPINDEIRLDTYKYKKYKNDTGKFEYVDIYIYNDKINCINPSNDDIYMSFDSLLTCELLEFDPDMLLRSYHFFRIDAEETTLMIFDHKEIFWLCTRINFTEDIVIEQYEPLEIVE
ncbi:hypothetical protein MTBBW1_2550013 [Desulfamplus magnetovallimortis]|uniref:Uncharacterized protein n=1 Tax=Desulfamplus magnetovallimortis TaxID=1246637 RepID=A0A1W1HEN8_9BACT|nr:hypothetical protein [Desulfamplus magnetovallimortis]SLM30959.1 hypothetical protein MTBBW1_2550013 [Desulfamplus magnetovallimortis]